MRMRFLLFGAAIVVGTIVGCIMPVYAKCKIVKFCQPGQENCEPQCFTSSDGGPGKDNMYTIDPAWAARQRARAYRERQYRQTHDGDYRFTQTKEYQQSAQQRGAAAWANDGIKTDRVGTISPFVPGSTEDKAWRAERARRGIQ